MKLQIDELGFVGINVEDWDINRSYRKPTIVTDYNTWTTYITRKNVPAGILITDNEYWKPILKGNGSTPIPIIIDPQPTKDSPCAVSSGGTFNMIQDATNVNAIETTDGKIYNDYQAGDIFFIVDNNIRKYRVALVAGAADAEHPVIISPVNFYYALNSADAINRSLKLKTLSTEQQQSLTPKQQVQAQNNLMAKAYAPAQFSGLGKKLLSKNMQTVGGVQKNVMTHAFFQNTQGEPLANTAFVIQYDYDLNGQTVDIPANCKIIFDGGSVNNGTFKFNSAVVEGEPRGNALYGIAYKEGQPLSHNYSKFEPISLIYDHAYSLRTQNGAGSPFRISFNDQSICVTDSNIFVFGNDEFTPGHIDEGLVIMFDRNFNYLGEARMGAKFGHMQGCCIVDDDFLSIDTANSESRGKINRIAIQTVKNACLNNSDINDSDVYSQTVSEWEAALGITYDADRSQIFIHDIAIVDDKYKTNLLIYSWDKNTKTASFVKRFDTNIYQYTVENLIKNSGGSFLSDHTRGQFGDMAIMNGVIYTTFWDNGGQENEGYSADYELSYLIAIDANTGTPVINLGIMAGTNHTFEPEGLCFDPNDRDVLWSVHHSNLSIAGEPIRQGSGYICRCSISKILSSDVLAFSNEPDGTGFSTQEETCVYIDNNYTGFSVGDMHAPFKTFDAAFILAQGRDNIRYIFKDSDKEYNLGKINISAPFVSLRGYSGNKNAVKLKGHLKVTQGCHLELLSVTFNEYETISSINTLFSNVTLSNVNMFRRTNESSEPSSALPGIAVELNSSNLRIEPSCLFSGYSTVVQLFRHSSIGRVADFTARYTNKIYEVLDSEKIYYEAIKAANVDSTVNHIVMYSNEVGNYIRNYNNLLVGTDNIEAIADSNTQTSNSSKWKQIGDYPAPSITSVAVKRYPKIKTGLLFSSNKMVRKGFYLSDSGWLTISFLAKGSGKIDYNVYYNRKDGSYMERYFSTTINTESWQLVVGTLYANDVLSTEGGEGMISIYSGDNANFELCAFKVEVNDYATAWCSNDDYSKSSGTTLERPHGVSIGFQYFDISLSPARPIYYAGNEQWVDASGNNI